MQGSSFDAFDEQQCQEFVKCVIVGDTAVGKTRLLCSYVFDQPNMPINAMYKPHIPTVFAIDQYAGNPIIRDRSKIIIDGIQVQLQIWDTFGDHEKNRRYAYQNAHVVVLCFSIGMQSSLRNVNAKWYPEIKKYCPRAAIILVGTQLDRRHTDPLLFKNSTQVTTLTDLLRSNSFPSIFMSKRQLVNKSSALVLPEIGRQTSWEIGAAGYLEVSIVTKHGVDEVFENAVKAALILRNHTRHFFWSHLKCLKGISLQKPYLPPPPPTPTIKKSNTNKFIDFSNLYCDEALPDIEFLVGDKFFKAHSFVLISSDEVFYTIFMHPYILQKLGNHPVCNEVVKSDLNLQNSIIDGIGFDDIPRGFDTIDILADPVSKCKIFIKIDCVSSKSFQELLEFYYCGRITNICDPIQLQKTASVLQLSMLFTYVTNIIENNLSFNNSLINLIYEQRKVYTKNIYKRAVYSDIGFLVDNCLIPAHRQLLCSQCSVIAGMFRNESFSESSKQIIAFDSFEEEALESVLEYFYTGGCSNYHDVYATLKLANYLCLQRLLELCQVEIADNISDMHKQLNPDVYSIVLYTYSFARFHNAKQLEKWSFHFMATNYNGMCQHVNKELRALDANTLKTLEEQRWPPVWYLKEQDFYERALRAQDAAKNERLAKKRNKKRHSCF